jgi:hypothetical protein
MSLDQQDAPQEKQRQPAGQRNPYPFPQGKSASNGRKYEEQQSYDQQVEQQSFYQRLERCWAMVPCEFLHVDEVEDRLGKKHKGDAEAGCCTLDQAAF